MTTLPITAIHIDRDRRQRKELVDIEELALSINTVGLINPIVVNSDGRLIAGERRYTAMQSLGWTDVPVTIFDDLSEHEQHLIELEENVKRAELPWRDHTAAVAEYHRLRVEADPEWTMVATADQLGMSKQHLQQRLSVQEALDSGNELVCKAEKYSVARGIVQRQAQRASTAGSEQVDNALDDVLGTLSEPTAPPTEPARVITETIEEAEAIDLPTFINEEFAVFSENYAGPRFNFLHCDFPYGVNADKHAQGASDKFGGYADGEDVYWSLLEELMVFINLHVETNFHMMFWFSMDFYSETKAFFEEHELTVNPFPLIWHKTDNSGILPDPKRGPRRIYETAFLVTGGERYVVQPVANTIGHANVKGIHMSEKPQEMLRHFFRMFVDETTVMLDPTMGSGNAPALAHEMGAKLAVGVERDEEFFLAACQEHLK